MLTVLKPLTFSLLLLCTIQSISQKKTVLLEPLKRKINQDAPLPAQNYFNIQVPVNNGTAMVTINISHGKKMNGSFETVSWERPVGFTGDFAELPVDIKLKSNSNYSFDVSIYHYLNAAEKSRLKNIIAGYIHSYLDAIVISTGEKMNLSQKNDQIISDLNEIVRKSLLDYTSFKRQEFQGFSSIIKIKLQQISTVKLTDAASNINRPGTDSVLTDDQLKNQYILQLKTELRTIVDNELFNYLDADFVQRYDHFAVNNQYTEKTQTVLPLFIGYGAVYFGGNVHDLDYDSKPYAGISIPLGSGDGKYFSRTTFILGVFINNFKNAADSVITGPLVDRPVFAGLGFRIYDFINFNAGMVATSTSKLNLSNIKVEDVKLRPFIGLNFQFNLWLGVNKK